MSTDRLIQEMRHRCAEVAADIAADNFDDFLGACDSPIERLFVGELLAAHMVVADVDMTGREWNLATQVRTEGAYPKTRGRLQMDIRRIDADAWIYGQFPVSLGKRHVRLDFAIMIDWVSRWEGSGIQAKTAWIAVECDGHSFHERTKEQAASDRSRDRMLAEGGWTVLRFTGSELYANPSGCVEEFVRIMGSTNPGRRQ